MDYDAGGEPLVSIITAFYNRAEHVAASVGSLLAQTYRNLQVVVIDDGSTDGTAAALRRFDDPRLHLVEQPNAGFTVSMNRALALTKGEFVAVHDAGDISHPDRIAEQVKLLLAKPEVGVVGCWVEDDSNVSDAVNVIRPPDGLPFFETLRRRSLFTHGEVMARRALYERAGGYREFFRFAQDRDLWMRMSPNTEYAILPRVLYRRVKIAGGVSTSPEKLVLQAYLSDFAVQCAERRDAQGHDLLDRYGHLGPFFRHRSRATARRIGWLGARMMVMGDVDAGWQLVRRARAEFLSRQVLTIWMLAALHRAPALWKLVGRPVLLRRLRSFER